LQQIGIVRDDPVDTERLHPAHLISRLHRPGLDKYVPLMTLLQQFRRHQMKIGIIEGWLKTKRTDIVTKSCILVVRKIAERDIGTQTVDHLQRTHVERLNDQPSAQTATAV